MTSSKVPLRYGNGELNIEISERASVLECPIRWDPLSDLEINAELDRPIDSHRLEDIVAPGESVLIVVPDATRQAGAGQIVNLVVRRLISNGTAPHAIRAIFATGIHRKTRQDEKVEILTPFIANRIKTLDHDPRDLFSLVSLGETATGIPIEVNRALLDHDHVIMVGGVSYHYFAGFSGGRKLICPGLSSSRTIAGTHKLAFDCETLDRREGVGTARLNGNAVHEAFVEAVQKVPPSFSINTIIDPLGLVTAVYCGDWQTAHEAACTAFDRDHSIQISEKRDLVVVSCGGDPHDLNLIQAHKALDAAAAACKSGGTIILIAECRDGLGRPDFLSWFDASDSYDLARRVCEKYQVNGQTAWSLLKKAEKFRVQIVTSLDEDAVKQMRLEKIEAATVSKEITAAASSYIIPEGAKIRLEVNS